MHEIERAYLPWKKLPLAIRRGDGFEVREAPADIHVASETVKLAGYCGDDERASGQSVEMHWVGRGFEPSKFHAETECDGRSRCRRVRLPVAYEQERENLRDLSARVSGVKYERKLDRMAAGFVVPEIEEAWRQK